MDESSEEPTPEEAALTVILNAAFGGDDAASRKLWDAVYEDLRAMAHRSVAKESSQELEPTQVVHEVFLRLNGSSLASWDNRRHFFGAAVRAMERFLVDHARERKAAKRGGGMTPVSLSVFAGELGGYDEATRAASDGLIASLEELAAIDEAAAEVARLRWLVGLSSEQVATILECSVRKVQLDWRFAKAFLQRRLAEIDE